MQMSGKYLLDTNIVIALFANDPAVVGKIEKTEEIFVPSVVIGELFYGAKKSGRPERNSERIEIFVSDNMILSCNARIARLYGKVKNSLRKKGRPIPENDIWIAATAFQHDLILVSRDEHFEAVEDLKLEIW
uniref:Ribonuclease VapC n=1 Tax=Candidatus Kentrum sp. LFY TaxID=2126342 RepID=A0A450V9A1_9GAMM|nr:MAG: tRNA(fMet)-specific endonuclease VapC [Candidatus Kentron sp. LFY]